LGERKGILSVTRIFKGSLMKQVKEENRGVLANSCASGNYYQYYYQFMTIIQDDLQQGGCYGSW